MAAGVSNPLSALALIAERRIQEAAERGELDNLPGMGQPLVLEDLSGVPEDARMAYKILKNANCLPPEILARKEAASLAEMLASCPDEREKYRQMRRLRLLLERMNRGGCRHMALEAHDDYYNKILALLEKAERSGSNK